MEFPGRLGRVAEQRARRFPERYLEKLVRNYFRRSERPDVPPGEIISELARTTEMSAARIRSIRDAIEPHRRRRRG